MNLSGSIETGKQAAEIWEYPMSKQKTKNKQTAKDKVICEWTDVAWDDYLHGYQNSETYFEKIDSFIEECKRTPI